MTAPVPISFDPVTSQAVLDAIPFSAYVYRADGLCVIQNKAAEEIWGVPSALVVGIFNAFENSGGIDPGVLDAVKRAIGGVTAYTAPVLVDLKKMGEYGKVSQRKAWMEHICSPLRSADGNVSHVLILQRDITEFIEQRETVLALSSPIIEVWEGVLTLPLIGYITAQRASDMTEKLLAAVVRTRAQYVILDLTGVNTIDGETAGRLLHIVRAVSLLGARGLIAGVHPEVSRMLASLELDLQSFHSHRSLREALLYCVRSSSSGKLY